MRAQMSLGRVYMFLSALSLFLAFMLAMTEANALMLAPLCILGGFFYVTAHLF